MNISIMMTVSEIESAMGACSSMDDNEHDKGAADDAWQDSVITGAINALNEAWKTRNDHASAPVVMGAAEFGLMCDAVEIFCTDPADDSDPIRMATDQALAKRLLALGTVAAEVAPSGSIQGAAQGFANLVRQHIAASDLEAIEHLANAARPVDEDDWGSERQVAAENAFNIAAEALMTPMQAKFWETFGLHATSDERIDQALAILEGRSAAFDTWELGGR